MTRPNTIRVGDYAQLAVTDRDGTTELVWVRVRRAARNGPRRYLGTIVTEPARVTAWRYGDRISFEPRNVVDVERPKILA